MTLAQINGISIHYQLEGDKDTPVLVLCNSLGTTLEMWEPQIATLLTQF
jgi:3-oxoadipate enol-lactonase